MSANQNRKNYWAVKHDMSHSRVYNIWRDMKHRCYCPGLKNYKDYGRRGIVLCNEWRDNFMMFYEWAINNGYSDDLTIDRIDVNGNYEPNNCRWSNKSTQNANRRNIGKCEYIGVSLHSNGSSYQTSIKYNGKRIFSFQSRSKNECAIKRNEFIVKHNLPHPLNAVNPEYEDVRKHKNDYLFTAEEIESGKTISFTKLKDLAKEIGLTPEFIEQCISGKRNSKKYIFEKRCLYE